MPPKDSTRTPDDVYTQTSIEDVSLSLPKKALGMFANIQSEQSRPMEASRPSESSKDTRPEAKHIQPLKTSPRPYDNQPLTYTTGDNMRTMLNFAKNFHKHYPNHNKNMWAESLTKGDLILVNGRQAVYISHKAERLLNGRQAVYISHKAERLPNGMGGDKLVTTYTIVDHTSELVTIKDDYNSIEPLSE
jgi:hypothetical protein